MDILATYIIRQERVFSIIYGMICSLCVVVC